MAKVAIHQNSKFVSIVLSPIVTCIYRECDGVVVECWTLNREVLGSSPQASLCCVLEQDTLTP